MAYAIFARSLYISLALVGSPCVYSLAWIIRILLQQDNSQVEIDINSTSNFVCLEGPPGSAINLAPGSYIALSEQDVTFRRVANRLGSVHAVDGNAIYLDLDIDPSGSKTLLDPNKVSNEKIYGKTRWSFKSCEKNISCCKNICCKTNRLETIPILRQDQLIHW